MHNRGAKFIEIYQKGKIMQRENMLVVARHWEEEGIGHECYWVWGFFDENVLKLDSGDGYTWKYSENTKICKLYTLKEFKY